MEAPAKLAKLLNETMVSFNISSIRQNSDLLESIGDARIVLMGEATHGTHEFYQVRMELSKQLIENKGFHAIAIEGDWTSTHSIHRFIQGDGKKEEVLTALAGFDRFPTWMWRNPLMSDFLIWLRTFNDKKTHSIKKIGFYGLDLYCLYDAMQAVIDYLNKHNKMLAKKAIQHYSCFDHLHNLDPQMYGYLVDSGLQENCVQEATQQLLEMQALAFEKMHEGVPSDEMLFYATQNARLVKNAEHYYRAMFEARDITWNIRDEHMAETLQNVIAHIETINHSPAKVIIWAHNSHVGDARASEMSEKGEVNLGQIVRERFGTNSYHLGFTTYSGTVTAADDWGGPAKTKDIVPALPGSYESIFHQLNHKDFFLNMHQNESLRKLLQLSRLHRAIGVIYLPDSERDSHYFFSSLPYQFDAIIHIDITHNLKPLNVT